MELYLCLNLMKNWKKTVQRIRRWIEGHRGRRCGCMETYGSIGTWLVGCSAGKRPSRRSCRSAIWPARSRNLGLRFHRRVRCECTCNRICVCSKSQERERCFKHKFSMPRKTFLQFIVFPRSQVPIQGQ
jgi:hypothetical protein